jgi:hypothetical protein
VLTITPSESRIKGMLTLQRKITGNHAAAMFLYCTPERIAAEGAFAPIWTSAEADGIALLNRR